MSHHDDSRPNTPVLHSQPIHHTPHNADKIVFRLFNKFFLVVLGARATNLHEDGPRSGKVDKWFNLETADSDLYRDVLRQYRQISSHPQQTTLTLHVVLTIPELRSNQVLVLQESGSSRVRIDPTPRGVLLESWVLSLLSPSASSASSSDPQEVSLAAVYKHAISLFRSLYSITRILPASKLYKRLRTRSGTSQSLGLEVRMTTDLSGVLCFDTPLSSTHATPALTTVHAFPALSTPLGALRASVRYLASPNLAIDTLESVISSRFFSQDARNLQENLTDPTGGEESIAFTPTVLRHRARDSAASSPSSTSGLRVSSRAGTQIAPPSSSTQQRHLNPPGQSHSRTVSFPAVSGAQPMPLPNRTTNITGSTGSGSDKSTGPSGVPLGTSPNSNSPRFVQLRAEALPFATTSGRATPSRVRRESSSVQGAGADRPSTSTSPPLSTQQESGSSASGGGSVSRPDTGRKISIAAITPFKSSTFAAGSMNSPTSTPSMRTLPLSTAGTTATPSSTTSRPPSLPPLAPTGTGSNIRSASSPPSAVGIQFPTQPPPFAQLSTSAPKSTPNFVPPSPSAAISNKPTPTKRFSSSFGHRYASSGAAEASGSGGASGSGRTLPGLESSVPEVPTPRNRSLNVMLSPTEDEENLSDFINAIDKAGPLPSTVNSRQGSSGTGSGIRETGTPGAGSSSDSAGSSFMGLGPKQSGRPSPPRRPSSGTFERKRSPLMNVIPLPDLDGEEEGGHEGPHERGGHGSNRDPPSLSGAARALLTPGPMLTTQDELEERLRTMDATFANSMRDLRERRRAKGVSLDGGAGGFGGRLAELMANPSPPQAINAGGSNLRGPQSEQEGTNARLLPRRQLPQSPPQ